MAVATHLIPLLGLDGSVPAFPFATLAADAQALPKWLLALASGNPPPLVQWLEHLAGLLGVAAPVASSSSSGKTTIWTVPLFAPNAASAVTLGLVSGVAADGVTPTLGVQIGETLAPAAAGPAALTSAITLFTAPLSGPASASVLPSATAMVRAPATGVLAAPAAGSFSIDSVQAGIAWNGSGMAPLLQLTNVVIPAAGTYPVIDLTNANTVVAAAASGLVNTIVAGLGNGGAGQHLAALAGLVEPAADAAAPLVDLTQLVSNPMGAIATLHRNALLSAAHPWSIYLGELAALLGLPTAITGTGKTADPWAVPLASAGPLSLSVVAWNGQGSGNAADPQLLRLGLQAKLGAAPVALTWTSSLFAADLLASGANHVTLFAEHDAAVTLEPMAFSAGAIQLAATSAGATFALTAGAAAEVQASVSGLSLTTPAGSITVPTLAFPFPAGFDPTNPQPTLGITAAELEALAAALLSLALTDALGSAGTALAVLAGCGAGAPDLPAGLPGVADVAGGTLFTDPAGSLRAWLAKVATTAPGPASVVGWLAALLADDLPAPGFGPDPTALVGTGTYDDPLLLPVADPGSAAELLLWFEPDGPVSDAAGAAAAVTAAADFPSLVSAAAGAARYLGELPAGVDPTALATGLQSLSSYLSSSDGVVPASSQVPSGGTWGGGTALTSAHPDQPGDAAAIGQIIGQADAWVAPGNARAILLLGPAFSDHTIWAPLLAQAEAAHAGSTNVGAFFDLRVAGVAPASIDLRPVTAVADYYTADLFDDGTNDVAGLVAQIGLITARLATLRAGAPVILVAHSTAGVAARAYAAANAGTVKGLITLGTPHLGAPLTPLLEGPSADALRVIADWLPAGVAAGPLQDALTHLTRALDGYLPPPSAGALPVAWPYPVADFTGAGTTDTGGVPAIALGGALGTDLLGALKTALAARIAGATVAAATHLSFGARYDWALGAPPASGGATTVPSASASVRADLGRLALTGGAAEPARPVQALTAAITLFVPGGWLAGDPRSYAGSAPAVDVRVRGARLGLTLAMNGGTLAGTPFAVLTDVAVHGPTTPLVGWTDPLFAPALGAVFAAIGTAPAGTRLGTLLTLLQSLGIATTATPVGIAADAVNALSTDPIGFLGPKLAAALAAGAVPGFAAAGSGQFTAPIGTLPLEAAVTLSPPSFGIRSTGSGLAPGGTVTATGSVALALPTMQASVSAALQAGPGSLSYANGALSLQVSGTILPLVPPPSASQAEAALIAMLPPLLVSSVGSALLDTLVSPGSRVTGLWSFLNGPWSWLIGPNALGNGTGLDPAKLTQLLGLLPALPAGLTVTATGSPGAPTITLNTGAPLGGVISISAGVAFDATGHAIPAVTIGVTTPTTGTWPNVGLTLGVSASGLSLVLTPGGMAAIELLPTFDGAAALAGAAKKLLPEALDALLAAVAPGPKPPLVTLALDVATALDLYDAVGGFAAHAAQLAALTGPGWFAALSGSARTAFLTAASAWFNDPTSPLHNALPGTIAVAGNALIWSYPLPGAIGSGSVALTAGWDGSGPTITIGTTILALANAPVTASLTGGFAAGNAALSGGLGVSLQSSLGLAVVPQLAFSLGGGTPASLALLPLGAGTASTLSLQLAPSVSLTAAAGAPVTLVEDWVIPLAADLLINATGTDFAQPVYTGGPAIDALLAAAGVITIGAGPAPGKYKLKTPLPGVDSIMAALLNAIPAVPVTLASNPSLTLLLGNLGGSLGAGLQGAIQIASGPPAISVLFGQPGDAATVPGVALTLFTTAMPPAFTPTLAVHGIGVGAGGDGSDPLFNERGIRIGGIEGFTAFTLDLAHPAVNGLGGGLEITGIGLPFGLLGGASSSNPVASALLGSDTGSGQGDSAPVNPALDVEVTYLNGSLGITIAGATQPIVIPVHASFGPIYIDQIDVALVAPSSLSIGIDGSVSIGPLNVGLDELAVLILIPLHRRTRRLDAGSARARRWFR